MDRLCNQKQFLFFVVLLTITSLYLCPAAYGDAGQATADEPQQAVKASLGQRLMSMATEVHKSSQGSIGKLKSLVSRVQERLFPPSVDFKSKENATPETGVGGSNMKDAAKKSFQASEATIEETAETASKMMGDTAQKTKETAQKTKEKVKEKVKGEEASKTKGAAQKTKETAQKTKDTAQKTKDTTQKTKEKVKGKAKQAKQALNDEL